jgi:hypothetical protein
LVLVLLTGAAFAASPLYPVIKNAGFEEEGGGIPQWELYPGSAIGAGIDTTNPHSGKRCLQFSNNIDKKILENFCKFQQWFGILPGMKYELSVWVRGENVASGNYFTDWNNFKMEVPAGTYGWKKVSKVFYAQNYLNWVCFGMNIDSPAKSFAIDDITLTPVPTVIKGKGVEVSYITPARVDGDDKNTPISISVNSSLKSDAAIEAVVTADNKQVFKKTGTIKPGKNTLDWEWNSGKLMNKNVAFSLRVIDAKGKEVASTKLGVEKLSTKIFFAEIDRVEKRLKGEFMSLYNECKAKGIPVDYPTATKTMIEQFIPLARKDAEGLEKRRAEFAIKDFNNSLDQSISEMRACLKDPKLAKVAVRYQSGKVRIDGLSVIGNRIDSKGNKSQGPLFFCGYGHFSQTRTDIPKFPGYGVNIIQHSEFGPSAVLPTENEVSYEAINTLIKALDDAEKNNVKIDFLISPHYFPGWPAAKWPQINGGFFGYAVDMPEAKFVNEKFLRIVIPLIKDKPALNSICLTNEAAAGNTTGIPNTKPMWINYLTEHFGDIQTLNSRYGSSYKSFDEVPMGGGGFEDPFFYDWAMFSRERYANWHKWMADVIHEMAPDLPVHSKICSIVTLTHRIYSNSGVDLDLMGRVSDFNGNDCCFYTDELDGFRSSWQLQNVAYDMQRSFNPKPIFNSENHISRDFSTNYIEPGHFRTVLWQGAIHGQASSTIWIWERATSGPATWGFYGNVMDRPGCAEAVGMTCMDLNRFASEVTALQKAKAPAAIVYSNVSFMRDSEYHERMNRAYEALNFCGVKVDFISEAQLGRGDGAKYGLIIAPQVTYMTDDGFKGLCNLPAKTRLIVIGDAPAKDPYMKALPEAGVKQIKAKALKLDGTLSSQKLWPVFLKELGSIKALPEYAVVDAKTGKPVWGVEWLLAKVNGKNVINIVNLADKPVEVKVVSGGKTVQAKDMLSLGGRENIRLLKPEMPVLAEVKP